MTFKGPLCFLMCSLAYLILTSATKQYKSLMFGYLKGHSRRCQRRGELEVCQLKIFRLFSHSCSIYINDLIKEMASTFKEKKKMHSLLTSFYNLADFLCFPTMVMLKLV